MQGQEHALHARLEVLHGDVVAGGGGHLEVGHPGGALPVQAGHHLAGVGGLEELVPPPRPDEDDVARPDGDALGPGHLVELGKCDLLPKEMADAQERDAKRRAAALENLGRPTE